MPVPVKVECIFIVVVAPELTKTSPTTPNCREGLLVPTPKNPDVETFKNVADPSNVEVAVLELLIAPERPRATVEIPPANEEVDTLALVIEPAEREIPAEEERPAAWIPPVKVEVAVDVFEIEPPEMRRPAEEERPAVAMPPVNVEVPVPRTSMVLVATRAVTVVVPEMTALPFTESGVPGVVVPIPRKPLESLIARKLEATIVDAE